MKYIEWTHEALHSLSLNWSFEAFHVSEDFCNLIDEMKLNFSTIRKSLESIRDFFNYSIIYHMLWINSVHTQGKPYSWLILCVHVSEWSKAFNLFWSRKNQHTLQCSKQSTQRSFHDLFVWKESLNECYIQQPKTLETAFKGKQAKGLL